MNLEQYVTWRRELINRNEISIFIKTSKRKDENF